MKNNFTSDIEKNMEGKTQHIIMEEGRRIKKLLAPIKKGESLSYYLNRLSKVELNEIRKRLGIKNASSLPKEGLIKVICPELINRIYYIVKNLGELEFDLLKKAVKMGGIIEGDFSDYDAIEGLQEWGIGFCGTIDALIYAVIVPGELIHKIKECFKDKKLLKAADAGQNFYRFVKGCLYYYGVFPVIKLYDIAEESFPLEASSDLLEYLFNNIGDNKDIGYYNGYVYNWQVTDPEHIINEHMARPNLDYIQLSYDKAIAAADDDYCEWNQNTTDLNNFFIKTGKLTIEEAKEMVNICIDHIKNDGSFNNIVNFIGENIKLPSFKAAEEMISILQNVYNCIRKWVLKGHTSDEVFEEEKKYMKPLPAKSQKIGRNEPCPCGSGKKYKNCCGRN